MNLRCRLFGHVTTKYAARSRGAHVMGTMCIRCGRILTARPGSRQERRRILRERLSA